MNKLFSPNQKLSSRDSSLLITGQFILIVLLWSLSNSLLLPRPKEILNAMWDLIVNRNIISDFLKSIMLCCKAMLIAVIISCMLAYSSVIPFFRPMISFLTKLRFLTTVGLSFLFMKLSSDVDQQKIMLLVYGVTVFFLTSILSIICSVPETKLNYARTLRLNSWKVVREAQIYETASSVYESIRQNFAMAWMMLAMVENLCKSQGGIGVVLSDLNKYFKFDYVYAIQFLILFTGLFIDWFMKVTKKFLFPYSLLATEKK